MLDTSTQDSAICVCVKMVVFARHLGLCRNGRLVPPTLSPGTKNTERASVVSPCERRTHRVESRGAVLDLETERRPRVAQNPIASDVARKEKGPFRRGHTRVQQRVVLLTPQTTHTTS